MTHHLVSISKGALAKRSCEVVERPVVVVGDGMRGNGTWEHPGAFELDRPHLSLTSRPWTYRTLW